MDEYHIVTAMSGFLGQVKQVRDNLRVDWTIPATWIIGLAVGMAVNLGVMIWKASSIIAVLDRAVIDLQFNRDEITRIRDRQVENEKEITRLGQADREQLDRLEVHARQIQALQERKK